MGVCLQRWLPRLMDCGLKSLRFSPLLCALRMRVRRKGDARKENVAEVGLIGTRGKTAMVCTQSVYLQEARLAEDGPTMASLVDRCSNPVFSLELSPYFSRVVSGPPIGRCTLSVLAFSPPPPNNVNKRNSETTNSQLEDLDEIFTRIPESGPKPADFSEAIGDAEEVVRCVQTTCFVVFAIS